MARGMIIENEFDIGEKVYLLTDEEQKIRLITSITVYPGENNIAYRCSCGQFESVHYSFELTKEPRLEGVKA